MSNPFAISAVTATFSQVLSAVNGESTLAGTQISTRAPDQARTGDGARQLNLFLYDVAPNNAWRNMDLPFRDGAGGYRNPPILALNLYYLVTAYGQHDDDLDAHHLLGHAMSVVNDQSILTHDQIHAVVDAPGAALSYAESDLELQIELVRLSLHPLSSDELFKLWSAFQTHYRLSVAYEAATVLIERPHRTHVAPPVHERTVTVLPLHRPLIDAVTPQVVTAGGTLTIEGHNLVANPAEVRFGAVPAAAFSGDDHTIQATLPAGLHAGVNTVQIVHTVALGSPPASHNGPASNVAAFMIAPSLIGLPVYDPLTPPAPVPVTRGATLAVSFTPQVTHLQRVTLLIGDVELAPNPAAYPASALTFPIPADLPTGTFLLRLRVDGADSPLVADPVKSSPTYNAYVWPKVTVT